MFNFGILGNPNYKIKQFLKDDNVLSIINSNTIYLMNVRSKTQTLLSYYLPSSKVAVNLDEISNYKYLITSVSNSFDNLDIIKSYKSIKKFDNHILLMKKDN